MDGLNLSKYQTLKKSAAKIFTKEQELADQIYSYFAKRLPFGKIMGIIKQTGYQCTYEMFQDVKHSDADNRLALFLWMTGKQTRGIKWEK